jgi:hypothetical protein
MILKREYALYDANPRYGLVRPEMTGTGCPYRPHIQRTDEDDPQRAAFVEEVLRRHATRVGVVTK